MCLQILFATIPSPNNITGLEAVWTECVHASIASRWIPTKKDQTSVVPKSSVLSSSSITLSSRAATLCFYDSEYPLKALKKLLFCADLVRSPPQTPLPSTAMTSSLLHPPAHLPPAVALRLSQQAPTLLQSTPSSISPYSLSSLWSAAESPELWTTYENLMLSCLRTGDEQSAHLCLERLTARFGAENERLMALRGLFQEATADDDAALKQVLEEYEAILKKDSSNVVCL